MEVVGKVIQGSVDKLQRISFAWVHGKEKETIHDVISDDSFLRDIVFSINHLDKYTLLTLEEKIEHIQRLGIVSWTGDSKANAKAASQIDRLIKIFEDETESIEIRIEIIKTLSLICCSSKASQNKLREDGFLSYMIEILRLTDPKLIDLQKWIVHALGSVLCDNTENQRYVLSFHHMKDTLSRFQTESWFCWRRNEATFLVSALFFGK